MKRFEVAQILRANQYTWHEGPPPHVGWWCASPYRGYNIWRWWNGHQWSVGVAACSNFHNLSALANIPDRMPPVRGRNVNPEERLARTTGFLNHSRILWCYYWPEDAVVGRFNPNTLRCTGSGVLTEDLCKHFPTLLKLMY